MVQMSEVVVQLLYHTHLTHLDISRTQEHVKLHLAPLR